MVKEEDKTKQGTGQDRTGQMRIDQEMNELMRAE